MFLCIFSVKDICNKARALFKDIQAGFAPLGSMAPVDQYYRFVLHVTELRMGWKDFTWSDDEVMILKCFLYQLIGS